MISVGAFALPGVSISYDLFIPILYRAVHRGFVSQVQAHFVHQGLRWGFDLGFSPDKLPGRRFFKNYPSALDAEQAVSKNILAASKTRNRILCFLLILPRFVGIYLRSSLLGACSLWEPSRSLMSLVPTGPLVITLGQVLMMPRRTITSATLFVVRRRLLVIWVMLFIWLFTMLTPLSPCSH